MCSLPACGAGGGGELRAGGAELAPELQLVRAALPRFRGAAESSWPPTAERVVEAHRALSKGDTKRAYHLLKKELDESPDDDEAALYFGMVYLQRSNYGAARPWFERILDHGPTFAGSADVFYWYGICLRGLGELDAAREALIAFLQFQPDHGKACCFLGEVALERGDLDEAAVRLKESLEHLLSAPGERPDADLAEAYASLGEVHLERGELPEAEEALQSSVRLVGDSFETRYKLARVQRLRGDEESAEQTLAALRRRAAPPGR